MFSKTSFQAPKIFPRMPRAIYHSDDVTFGYVRGGDVLEIASVDPQLGTVFYTLDQEKSPQPMLVRRAECIQCHDGPATSRRMMRLLKNEAVLHANLMKGKRVAWK